LTGDAIFRSYNLTEFDAELMVSSPRMYLDSTVFHSDTKLEKTGTGNDYSIGSNLFEGNLNIDNISPGTLAMGNTEGDTYEGDVTLNNTGQGHLIIANNSTDNVINGNLIVTEESDDANTYLSNGVNAELLIHGNLDISANGSGASTVVYAPNTGSLKVSGDVTIDNHGSGDNCQVIMANGVESVLEVGGDVDVINQGTNVYRRVFVGNNGSVNIQGTLSIENSASATHSFCHIGNTATSEVTLHDDLFLSVTDLACDGIIFGNTGPVTLKPACDIHISGPYIGGQLTFRNTTMENTTPQNIVLGTDARMTIDRSTWSSGIYAEADRIFSHETSYDGDVTFLKKGSGSDQSRGGNVIHGNLNWLNEGADYLMAGTQIPDSVMGDLLVQSSGEGRTYFAYNSPNNFVSGELQVLTKNNSLGVIVARGENSTLTVGGETLVESTVTTGTNTQILMGTHGDITFNDDLSMLNSASIQSSIITAYHTSSNVTVNGDASIINNGTGDNSFSSLAYLGQAHVTGSLTADNSGTGLTSQVTFADRVQSSLLIDGDCDLINDNSGTTHRIYLANSGDVVLGGELSIQNNSDANNSHVYVANGADASALIHGNVNLGVSQAGCDGIYFGSGMGETTLSPGVLILIPTEFNSGTLMFRNASVPGTNAQDITLTGTGSLLNDRSFWGGSLKATSPRIRSHECHYSSETYFHKTGAGSDLSRGGNFFETNATYRNSGSDYIMTGHSLADSVMGNLDLISEANGITYFATNSADNYVSGNLYMLSTLASRGLRVANANTSSITIDGDVEVKNTTSTAANSLSILGTNGETQVNGNIALWNSTTSANSSIALGYGATSKTTIHGDAKVYNDGNGTSNYIWINRAGNLTMNGDVNIDNICTATNSSIHLNQLGSAQCELNGNIYLDSSAPGSDGVYIGSSGGITSLNPGYAIITNESAFVSGNIYIRNLDQKGTTSSIIDAGDLVAFTSFMCDWEAPLKVSTGRVNIRESLFQSESSFSKNGVGNDACYGGNIFMSTARFFNNATHYLMPSNTFANIYEGDVYYTQNSSGRMYGSYNCESEFKKDIYFSVNNWCKLATAGNGKAIFNGTGDQTIYGLSGTIIPTFHRMEVNKTSGDLIIDQSIYISNLLELRNGIVLSSPTALPIVQNNALVNFTSDDSHVVGPIRKVGDDAFDFPVGNGSLYRPISISAPTSGIAAFEASYFHSDSDAFYEHDDRATDLLSLNNTEYWILDRVATSNAVSVKMSWDSATSSSIPTDLNDMAVCRWNGDKWYNHGNSSYTVTGAGGELWSENTISDFSPFTTGIKEFDIPLPIELLRFSAEKVGTSVKLNWTTSSEINNDYFTIERAKTSGDWEELTTIQAAGNSSIVLDYSTVDTHPFTGTSYYRLKQTDFDGQFEYFDPIAVSFDTELELEALLYPNPARDELHVSGLSGKITGVDLLNSMGQTLRTLAMREGQERLDLNVQELTNGMYFIRVKTATSEKSYPFVKD
jgi:hypothetical protein